MKNAAETRRDPRCSPQAELGASLARHTFYRDGVDLPGLLGG